VNTTETIGIVIVVILIIALVAATVRIATTRRQLRDRFGDEYDRVATEKGGKAAAEAELRRRERRHSTLPLRDLSQEQLSTYRSLWTELQARFLDDPVHAVQQADKLVARIVADRGYPVVDYQDRLAHLSVDHSRVLGNYRSAHDIHLRNDSGQATTEELRQAMVDYRAIITDLLGGDPAGPHPDGSPLPASESITDPEDEPVATRGTDPVDPDSAYREDTAAAHGADPADGLDHRDGAAPDHTRDAVGPAFDESGERVLDRADQSRPTEPRRARKGR